MNALLVLAGLCLVGQYPPEWLPRLRPCPLVASRPATPPELVRLIENSDLILKRDVTIGAIECVQRIEAGSSSRTALHFLVPSSADRRTYLKGTTWHSTDVICRRGESLWNWHKVLSAPALAVASRVPAPDLLWSPQGNHVVTRADIELLFEIVPKTPQVVVLP